MLKLTWMFSSINSLLYGRELFDNDYKRANNQQHMRHHPTNLANTWLKGPANPTRNNPE